MPSPQADGTWIPNGLQEVKEAVAEIDGGDMIVRNYNDALEAITPHQRFAVEQYVLALSGEALRLGAKNGRFEEQGKPPFFGRREGDGGERQR